MPTYNAEFYKPAREDGSVFVACRSLTVLDDTLCEHHERTVRARTIVCDTGAVPYRFRRTGIVAIT